MKRWPIFAGITCALTVALLLLFGSAGNADLPTTASTPAPTTTTAPTTEATTAPTTVPTEPLPTYSDPDETMLAARQVFVYDLTHQRLLYTYGDQTEQISPASLTKLMTCYVAMQYLDKNTVITVGEEAGWIAADSSIAVIGQGNVMTVEMILQGTLMQSGNDGAYVLAVAAGRAIAKDPNLDGRTALATFMAEMNSQLRSNGLVNTRFVTPDGYDAEGHYSTAEDLMQIARLALTDPTIVQYTAMEYANVTYESGEERYWVNTNWLLRQTDFPDLYCPEATGLKTGATSKAGHCLIATFDTGEQQLLIGVLGCELITQRFEVARFLFDHFRNPVE